VTIPVIEEDNDYDFKDYLEKALTGESKNNTDPGAGSQLFIECSCNWETSFA